MSMEFFELLQEHVELSRHMYVGWQDCETGAPEINPKRPYGDSDVAVSVGEILGWDVDLEDDDGECMSDENYRRADKLHREMETALQIILDTGSATAGRYVRGEFGRWGTES